jgi:hypothetical protein
MKAYKQTSTKKELIKDLKMHHKHLVFTKKNYWLVALEVAIFEGVSRKKSKTLPFEFSEAVKSVSNLEKSLAPFMLCVMKRMLRIKEVKEDASVLQSIKDVIYLWKKYPSGPNGARSAAQSVEWSNAKYDAEFCAHNASDKAAECAARSAQWSASESTIESAAWSAQSAAESAAWSENSSRSSKSDSYEYFSDEILKILKKCE